MTTKREVSLQGVVPLIQVTSLSASLDYYRDVLGFGLDFVWPNEENPKWAGISRDQVHFILTIDLGTSSSQFIAEKGNGVVFYIVVDNIEAIYDELDAKGAIIVQDIVEFGGRRQFSVGDSNGYIISFTEMF